MFSVILLLVLVVLLLLDFRGLLDFGNLIFRIATSDMPNFGQKRPFCGASTVWGFLYDFAPPQLRGLSKFQPLRFARFRKTNFRFAASDEAHFGLKRPFRGGANSVRISV